MQNFVNGFAPFRFNVTWEGSERSGFNRIKINDP